MPSDAYSQSSNKLRLAFAAKFADGETCEEQRESLGHRGEEPETSKRLPKSSNSTRPRNGVIGGYTT